MKNKCVIGGILKHNDGYGFKITFNNPETAQHYKDMIGWIIKNDKINTVVKKSYYDKK